MSLKCLAELTAAAWLAGIAVPMILGAIWASRR